MATSAQGHSEFAARIHRIEARGTGITEMLTGDERQIIGARKALRQAKGTCTGWVVKTPLALAVGALSFVAAKFTTFSIGEIPEEFSHPDYILGGEVMLALALIFTCRLFFSLSHKTHMVLSLAGLVAMLGLMHNLVHLEPDLWAQVFSYDWVANVLASTKPNTAQFRDMVFTLG
ncbi:hypothetical protein RXV86_06165 [Alisedimentitalea sp. MJ-SS2]|uniref:hypothetical protein n=1 Tax=Aliisedimentitalea sp. MJ-SS2 TaxID=3049795 RepID=UPI002915AAAB|nr:hypothetical protein [Alisedimentitalea sp. MJ-SS2]MDU8926962.1 hypothetical protein [Alisedimentitalea sp. MJ-SS2]